MNLRYWVYILSCSNGNYYTGYTTDLARRYQEHLAGTAKCKYTRSFKPTGLAQAWVVKESKVTALKMEAFIKKLPRSEKEQLILKPTLLSQQFSCRVWKAKLPDL